MATTTPDGLFYPVGTDAVAPLNTVMANMQSSVQVALAKRQRFNFVWANSAARVAQSGMVDGSTGYQTDTKVEYIYNGSTAQWVIYSGATAAPTAVLAGNIPPVGTRYITQAGRNLVNTVASGDATITFPTPFPNGVITASLERIDFSNYGPTFHILNTVQSLSAMNFRAYGTNGVALASLTAIPYVWSAVGW